MISAVVRKLALLVERVFEFVPGAEVVGFKRVIVGDDRMIVAILIRPDDRLPRLDGELRWIVLKILDRDLVLLGVLILLRVGGDAQADGEDQNQRGGYRSNHAAPTLMDTFATPP